MIILINQDGVAASRFENVSEVPPQFPNAIAEFDWRFPDTLPQHVQDADVIFGADIVPVVDSDLTAADLRPWLDNPSYRHF